MSGLHEEVQPTGESSHFLQRFFLEAQLILSLGNKVSNYGCLPLIAMV